MKQAPLARDGRPLAGGVADGVEDYCRRVSRGLAGASFEQKRRLVELLIDRVIVTEEEVEVRYVISTRGSRPVVVTCGQTIYHRTQSRMMTDAE
jgi:hypothetical protein